MNNLLPAKKTWREFNNEKRKRKSDRIIKKLDKIKAKEEVKASEKPIPVSNPGEPKILRTCSIAIPGSILENAQTVELRTYVAGQIARAACIYKVNEVVVFDDTGETVQNNQEVGPNAEESYKTNGHEAQANKFCVQFARLLQYLECPQYLRKHFFPIHKDLQFIGLINPLDAPHHLRQTEECDFREGITTTKPTKSGSGCYVNVGLSKEVKIDEKLDSNLRVTVKLRKKTEGGKKLYGVVVSPEAPTREQNLYWGYSVRIANSLSEVLLKSPFPNGYDLSIGTSDKGRSVDEVKKKELKNYNHAIIVFGGLRGLEAALEHDEIKVETPAHLFDHYLNTCPSQGSRTIRTEEAVLITLAELRKKL